MSITALLIKGLKVAGHLLPLLKQADGDAKPPSISPQPEEIFLPNILDQITPDLIKKVFIHTPLPTIETYLPLILQALKAKGLISKNIVLYAFATLFVENDKFKPISEKPSKYSDLDGQAPYDFSKYDKMTSLGNTPEVDGDGELFKGRGFIQITGRNNYSYMDKKLKLDGGLLESPDAANEPHIASAIFAQFIFDIKDKVEAALTVRDFKKARTFVNGKAALHWEKMRDAFMELENLILD